MGLNSLIFALTSAASLPSFRDVALEDRCVALAQFVGALEATEKTYRPGGCGEGNGLGGALYTFDFKLGELATDHRLTVAFEGDGPVKVVAKPSRDPLEKAVAKWVGALPTALTIYGQTYDVFVKGVLAYQGYFPALKGDKPTTLKFQLVPDADPRTGKVRFDAKVDPDFLKCFSCEDAKCLNEEVRYQFQERFFGLIRKAADTYGAGWIIQGPLPIGAGGTAWKFVCGVSRYSLENVNL